MSIPAFAWAFEQGRSHKLSANDRMVLIYLANRANGSLVCWPGQETIAEWTGISSRRVRDSTDRLEAAGLIRIERRGKHCEYRILRPLNGEDHSPTPDATSAITPDAVSAEHRTERPVSTPDTGRYCTAHRTLRPKTPDTPSGNTVLETEEKLKKAEGQDFEEEEGKEENPPNLIDTQPLVAALARSMFSNYPPRAPARSPTEQIEELDGELLPPIRRGPVEPERTVEQQLAALGFTRTPDGRLEARP